MDLLRLQFLNLRTLRILQPKHPENLALLSKKVLDVSFRTVYLEPLTLNLLTSHIS